jgi:hypothetical protein
MDENRPTNWNTAGQIPLWPLEVLSAARKAVPAVDYALGAAGVAVAAAIVTFLLGRGQVACIILGAMLVAMILLFSFAKLISSRAPSVVRSGIVLLWAVTAFFCTFLVFTVSAVAFAWPPTWAAILGLHSGAPGDSLPQADNIGLGAKFRDGPSLGTTGDCSPVIVTSNGQPKTEIRCNK